MSSYNELFDEDAQEALNFPTGEENNCDEDNDDYDSDASDCESDDISSDSSGIDTPSESGSDFDEDEDEDEDEAEEMDEEMDEDDDLEDDDDTTHYDAKELHEDHSDIEQHETQRTLPSHQFLAQYPAGTQGQVIEQAYQAYLATPFAFKDIPVPQNNGQLRNITIGGVSYDYRAVPRLVRSPFYTQDQKWTVLGQCPRSVLDQMYTDAADAYGDLFSTPLSRPADDQPSPVVQQVLQAISAMAPPVQPAQHPQVQLSQVQPQVQQPPMQPLQIQNPQFQQSQVQQPQTQQPIVQQPAVQQPQAQQPQAQQQQQPANPPAAQPAQKTAPTVNHVLLPPLAPNPVYQMATQLNYDCAGLDESTYFPLDPNNWAPAPAPNAPVPIYPAYAGHFQTGAQAAAYRKRSKVHPGKKTMADDLERVRRHGRQYWVRSLYEAMIDVSEIRDGVASVHRLRITHSVAFGAVCLEATAHKVFDKALEAHERGWNRPAIYHKRVVRGKLKDRSEESVERRLSRLCMCFRLQKATVDDAVRGGISLALLCDNPDARHGTKDSNNIGNNKRGDRLAYAKAQEEKEKAKALKKAESEAKKAAKAAEKAAKKAEKEQIKQQKLQEKLFKQQQRASQGRVN